MNGNKRELSHADIKLLAIAVTEVWPELEKRGSRELVADWRKLLDRFKLETTEKRKSR